MAEPAPGVYSPDQLRARYTRTVFHLGHGDALIVDHKWSNLSPSVQRRLELHARRLRDELLDLGIPTRLLQLGPLDNAYDLDEGDRR